MLRELAVHKSVRGRYEEFFLLLSDIRDGFSRGLSSREWLEPLRLTDVLAIDELGKGGKNREWEQGVLDEIISVRYNAGRPTLLSTNYPRATSDWEFKADGAAAETLEQRVGPRIFSRIHEMCDEILRRNLKFEWIANTRADCVDYPLLKHMHRAGCRRIYYGWESGSQRMLDVLKKDLTPEVIV